MNPGQVDSPIQLVVEGDQVASFLKGFIKRLELEKVQVSSFGGKTELRGYLKSLSAVSGFHTVVQRLGIIRDADDNVDGAFRSCCSALRKANLPVPTAPKTLTTETPRVSVFVLPDCCSTGKLETLLLQSVDHLNEMRCIRNLVKCVAKGDREKSLVHTYLACCPGPDTGIGTAVEKNSFPFDSEAFGPIKSFLSDLANL